MNLAGKRVLLRPLEKEDMLFFHKMINDGKVEELVVGWSNPISKEQQELWFERQRQDSNTIRYAIDIQGEVVGTCMIDNIDWKNRNAGISIKIGKDSAQHKGYGSECIELILQYAFEELNLHRLYVDILDYNLASQHLFEKMNFKLEGKQRSCVFKKNQYHDLLKYGLLKEEYENKEE